MKEKEQERLKHMLEIEDDLYSKGYKLICGVDEAGRGPLCGPVVAAAVILKPDDMIEGVNDSKKVSEKKREKFLLFLPLHFLRFFWAWSAAFPIPEICYPA